MENTATHKALKILLSFTPDNKELGTGEISRRLGFHTATVSRNLKTLTEYGFLHKNPTTKKYRLGHSVIALWNALEHSLNTELIQLAMPFIDDLRNTVNESVVLEVLSEDTAVMAYIAQVNAPLQIKGTLGDHRPLHISAGGKAILAFMDENERRQILKGKLQSRTVNTLVDQAVIETHLNEIRVQGFAFDNEEVNIGINAFGAPVFNYQKKPVAAVVVAGPASRISMAKNGSIPEAVISTARQISAELLYENNQPRRKRATRRIQK